MVRSNTLLIKHLPYQLNEKEKKEFLTYFGAVDVKFITSKCNKYNIAFASFTDENTAESVLQRLHQKILLDSRLSVEFAKNKNITSSCIRQDFVNTCNEAVKENEKLYKQFIEKLMSWQTGVNFKEPIPYHLKYQYPPPNVQTLINIIKVLATVPKFYTQVLHLMNKMNLPCPFGKNILPDFKLDLPIFNNEDNFAVHKKEQNTVSQQVETSESELSSDEELNLHKETIPEKFKIKKKTNIKVCKFVKPVSVISRKSKTSFDDVFEQLKEEKKPKKIKVSQIIPIIEPATPPKQSDTEISDTRSGFGYIHPIKKTDNLENLKDARDEREEERLEKVEVTCISKKELSENRITEKDRSMLPVFKNYAEGAPTCRLYIKNLAKTVTDGDLRYIYNRYIAPNISDETNMFDIRLMQEGRMKGQAFVTFQSIELANKALKETNGYILKDKPIVVQFARSATK